MAAAPSPLRPTADLPGLHIDLGQHTRPWAPDRGRWARPPAADYRCACGFADSAAGDAAVRAFTSTIHKIHRATCPNQQKTGATT